MGKLNYLELGKVNNLSTENSYSDTKPLIAAIEIEFGVKYSISGITKLFSRLGFSYKEKVAIPSKLDPDKQAAFVAQYEEIIKNMTDKCAIFLWMRFIRNIIRIPLKRGYPKAKLPIPLPI